MDNAEKKQFLVVFGKKIQAARKNKGISQEKLAHIAGIERSYMGRIERGESNPPIFTVNKLLKVLDIKASELGL